MNKRRFIVDTVAVISYFSHIFDDTPSRISSRARKIIDDAFNDFGETILIVPGVVFIEIFEKWFRSDELARKIYFEVLYPIREANNIEIREVDFEVIETFFRLDPTTIRLENRDRTILSFAVMLESGLITTDTNIKRYVQMNKLQIDVID